MKVLFIGGSGFISTSVSRLAVAKGMELFWLNRGQRQVSVPGVTVINADVHAAEQARQALGDHVFDVVVDWIAYTTDDIERDLALFRGRVKQFIFISSASAYQFAIRQSFPELGNSRRRDAGGSRPRTSG